MTRTLLVCRHQRLFAAIVRRWSTQETKFAERGRKVIYTLLGFIGSFRQPPCHRPQRFMSRNESCLSAYYPYRRFPTRQISSGADMRLASTGVNVGRCILEHLLERGLDVNPVHCIPRYLGGSDANFNSPVSQQYWYYDSSAH
jgi:hypothetical protein